MQVRRGSTNCGQGVFAAEEDEEASEYKGSVDESSVESPPDGLPFNCVSGVRGGSRSFRSFWRLAFVSTSSACCVLLKRRSRDWLEQAPGRTSL